MTMPRQRAIGVTIVSLALLLISQTGPAIGDDKPEAVVKVMIVPSPTPAPKPSAILRFGDASDDTHAKVVFAMSLAPDPGINARLSVELAAQLMQAQIKPSNVQIVPAPGWTLDAFLTQCAKDPSVRGAVIILPPAVQSGTDNYLFFQAAWTYLEFGALVTTCFEQSDPKTTSSERRGAAVAWFPAHINGGRGTRHGVSLLPLAAAATAISAIGGRRSATRTQETDSAYATPSPAASPGARFPTIAKDTTVTQINGNDDATLVATTILSQLSTANLTIGQTASPDAQTAKAARIAIRHLMEDLLASCPSVACTWLGH